MIKRSYILIIISVLLILVLQQVAIKPARARGVDAVNLLQVAMISSKSSASPNSNEIQASIKHPSNANSYQIAAVNAQTILSNTYLPMSLMTKEQNLVYSTSYSANIAIPTKSMSVAAPHEVAIKLVGNDQINLSDPIQLSGNLKDVTTGTGVPDKSIKFYTNGSILAQTHTNTDGTYQVKIDKILPAGDYRVTASFDGAHLLAAASTGISLKILPATIQIQTVPSVAGITFNINGISFISGPDGSARVQINQAGQYQLNVLLDQYNNPSQQVQFGRWSEETNQPFRMIQVPDNHVIQVGLNVYHKVAFKFVDLEGVNVDPSRISSITIRSIQGDIFTLKPGDTPWLPSMRTARRLTGLEQTDLEYSVNSVVIDGSNVVNSAQQRFFAKTDDVWPVSLLLYGMHITAKDALLRTPLGTSVNILLPDGQTNNYVLAKPGLLDLHSLARGEYKVTLLGVHGFGTSTPVALSRDQVVNINIVTKLDLILFFSVSMIGAIGLIIYGRPWLLHIPTKKRNAFVRKDNKDAGE